MKIKSRLLRLGALAALIFAATTVRAESGADDTQERLVRQKQFLEIQLKMFPKTAHSKYNRMMRKKIQAALNEVNAKIAELSQPPVEKYPIDDWPPELTPIIGVPYPIGVPNPIEDIEERLKERTEYGDDGVDDEEQDADDDDDDDDDEPETEPHRIWLEKFVDEKMEGVPDSAWSRTLYNAYFEAYAILKADATCPPDLLAEVAALCGQFREGEEFLDGDSGEQSGEGGGDEPVADGGEVETHDD